jgi:hypothetical protein
MSEQKQFVKNTNAPPSDSVLWQIGEDWKIATGTCNIYTAFKNLTNEDVRKALKEQKVKKELVQIGDYYLVCKAFQKGDLSCYAYDLTQKDKAEKEMGFAIKALLALDAANANVSQQQLTATVPAQTKPTTAPTMQASVQTVNNKLSQTIEVSYDHEPIEWDDAMGIESAIQDGKIPLPVKYVGVENWGFEGKDGKRTFWYGRIKLIRVQEE